MAKDKGVFYEGDWSDYYVDVNNLDLNQKIKRTLEIDEIEKEVQRKKRGILSWISVPFILLALAVLMLLINMIPITVLRCITMLVLATVSIIILAPIAIKPKNQVKFRWRKWVIIFVVWLCGVNSIKPPTGGAAYGISTLILFFAAVFSMSLVFLFIYISLSRSGHDEMSEIAKKEKENLTDDIYLKISSGRIEPIKLEYDIILGQKEIPLLETQSVLVKSLTTEEYYENKNVMNQVNSINISSWFDKGKLTLNTDKIISDVNKIVSNVGSNIGQMFGSTPPATAPKIHTLPNNINQSDLKGTLILTNERILFVGSSRGFEIKYVSLASCALSRNQKEIISFETEDMMRILATNYSYWVKLYVDRMARDVRF